MGAASVFRGMRNLSIDWPSIVGEHGRMVFRTAFRIVGCAADAEDVSQEVFAEAFCHANSHKINNWAAWLRKLTVFRALDRRRSQRANVSLNADVLATAELSPHDEAVRRELAERLRDMISALPRRQGAVFALRYLERLSNPQIAQTLGISTGAVAAALHKVRAKIEAAVTETPTGEST
jgi:RNA polymerase sigma-70 factor (ECF subfamily)